MRTACTDEVEAREGGEIVAEEPGAVDAGIGGGAHGDDDVAELDIRVRGAAAADPHDAFDAEVLHELGEVDRCRGNPHPVRHDRDVEAAVAAGETEDVADIADLRGILEIGLGDVLRPQRIAGHEDGGREIAGFGVDVRCGHGFPPNGKYTESHPASASASAPVSVSVPVPVPVPDDDPDRRKVARRSRRWTQIHRSIATTNE